MSNIPFINKIFIPSNKKFDVGEVETYIWDDCDNKYEFNFAKLDYIYLTKTKKLWQSKATPAICVNLDTSGIVHLLYFEQSEGVYEEDTYISIIYTKLNIIKGICNVSLAFNKADLYAAYCMHDYDEKNPLYVPQIRDSFDIKDTVNLPEDLYVNNYIPPLIRIYTLAARLHHQIKTFQLCIYRKVPSKDIRQKIYSYLFFIQM